jgi:hypothetical protein
MLERKKDQGRVKIETNRTHLALVYNCRYLVMFFKGTVGIWLDLAQSSFAASFCAAAVFLIIISRGSPCTCYQRA